MAICTHLLSTLHKTQIQQRIIQKIHWNGTHRLKSRYLQLITIEKIKKTIILKYEAKFDEYKPRFKTKLAKIKHNRFTVNPCKRITERKTVSRGISLDLVLK